MADVQPLLYIDDIEAAIAFYRDGLGLEVVVFGSDADGRPATFLAQLGDAKFLVSREAHFAGATGGGVTLYFHLDTPVDDYSDRFRNAEGVQVAQDLTNQWWGDRTLTIRDPWGYTLLFSSPVPG
jgi:PhnB protein